jgi:hypothetical protein
MAATTACSVDGCDGPHRARGMCARHYEQARRRALRSRNNNGGAGHEPPNVGARLASLRLAVEAAHARLSQAVIVAEYPHVGAAKGVTVRDLIDDALDELDRGRY